MLRNLFCFLMPLAPCLTIFGFLLFHYPVKAWGIFLGAFLDRNIQNRVTLFIKTAEHKAFRDGMCLDNISVVSFLLNYNVLYFHCKHFKSRY